MINERTIFFLACAQGLLGLFALRNVLNHRLKLPRVALVLKQAADPVLMPDHAIVRRGEAVIKGNHRLIRRQGVDVA